jgi:hypothetical protein
MAMSPNEFRDRAAEHAEAALSVAAEIVGNEELSPTVRLEAGKWITKVADLEPKLNPQGGRGEPFSIVINMGDKNVALVPPVGAPPNLLDRLLDID